MFGEQAGGGGKKGLMDEPCCVKGGGGRDKSGLEDNPSGLDHFSKSRRLDIYTGQDFPLTGSQTSCSEQVYLKPMIQGYTQLNSTDNDPYSKIVSTAVAP